MKFTKYPTIENANSKSVEKVFKIAGKEIFAIQEKINGEHFSVFMDGKTFDYAKKSDFLKEEELYFNYDEIMKSLKPKFIKLYNKIVEKYNKNSIIFYGTLCGGEYNEITVDKIPEQVKIRKGVDYSPKNIFVGIDIKVNDEFLPVDEAMNFYENFKFNFSRVIAKGSLYECVKLKSEFITTIPVDLLLPEIEGNICKGIVVKLNKPLKNKSRPSLQKINKAFVEKKVKVMKKVLEKKDEV
ncbi:MAG: RNA ligase family protein [Promethearchaeota archaeon]